MVGEFHRDFLYWLSTADHGARQADLMDKPQERTGKWLLRSPEFIGSVKGPSCTLLYSGISGAGKTYMAALVVNHLRETLLRHEFISVAVLYCSYSVRDEQTKEKLLAGLLRQLIKHHHSGSTEVEAFYQQSQTPNVGRHSASCLACSSMWQAHT